jgi:hypothetical protein
MIGLDEVRDVADAILSCSGGFRTENVMGRVGFEPTNPAMSRRYLNQARPPAPLYSLFEFSH